MVDQKLQDVDLFVDNGEAVQEAIDAIDNAQQKLAKVDGKKARKLRLFLSHLSFRGIG